MGITLSAWVFGGLISAAYLCGFGLARLQLAGGLPAGRKGEQAPEKERLARRMGKAIASPVSGVVKVLSEGGKRGVTILPEEGRVFSPVSGKIVRLCPAGNEFLLRTDLGMELRLQVGGSDEDMAERCYRPRVVRNEVVNKGKLLLEFDRERLAAQGCDYSVQMTLESGDGRREIEVTDRERVKNGQDCLWVV